MSSKALLSSTLIVVAIAIQSLPAHAVETATEKAQESADTTVKDAKVEARNMSDKTCMKSDLKCLKQKGKHKAQNAGDEVGNAASSAKKKID